VWGWVKGEASAREAGRGGGGVGWAGGRTAATGNGKQARSRALAAAHSTMTRPVYAHMQHTCRPAGSAHTQPLLVVVKLYASPV